MYGEFGAASPAEGGSEACRHIQSDVFLLMFDGRAFRTWIHVLAGACVLAVLFLGVMVMAEEVIGDGARITQAGLRMCAAAFVGYIAVAWLIRRDEARSQPFR